MNTHRNPEEIRRRIDYTRSRLDSRVDELVCRLKPGRLLRGAGENLDLGDLPSRALGAVKRHPLPTLLMGAGLVWLIAEDRGRDDDEWEYVSYGSKPRGYGEEATGAESAGHTSDGADGERWRDRARDAAAHGGEKLKHAGEKIRQGAEHLGDRLKHRAGRIGHGLGHSARSVGENVGHAASKFGHGVGDATRRVARRTARTAEERPLALGLGAFAAGLLGGLLAPSTRKEDEWFGEASERVRHEAMERGMHVAERAIEAAEEKAEEQGMTPRELASGAEAVGKAAFAGAREQLKEETKNVGRRGSSSASPGDAESGPGPVRSTPSGEFRESPPPAGGMEG